VLARAIGDGVALLTLQADTFAYAESFDEAKGRYQGLRGGQTVTVSPESAGLLVKPGVARRQLDAEVPTPQPSGPAGPGPGREVVAPGSDSGAATAPTASLPHRFHGTVSLDPARVGRDAGRIADEVIAHLSGIVGAEVTVTLEIEARIPAGASEQVVRTVTENSRTLNFKKSRV